VKLFDTTSINVIMMVVITPRAWYELLKTSSFPHLDYLTFDN
jgi:hypothetical protein